jgi:hypothetical protein
MPEPSQPSFDDLYDLDLPPGDEYMPTPPPAGVTYEQLVAHFAPWVAHVSAQPGFAERRLATKVDVVFTMD